jgi:hypothetical protein
VIDHIDIKMSDFFNTALRILLIRHIEVRVAMLVCSESTRGDMRIKSMFGAACAAILMIAGVALASETVLYVYDARGRLIRVEHSGEVNSNIVANYTYDPAGNRANVKVTGSQ